MWYQLPFQIGWCRIYPHEINTFLEGSIPSPHLLFSIHSRALKKSPWVEMDLLVEKLVHHESHLQTWGH